MSSRKRNHSSMNDDMDSQPPPKRRRVSPRSQRSQRYRKSQTQSQIPGIQDAENNVFWQLLQQCKIRMYGNTSKAIELDAAESIEYYLQRKLMRDRNKRKRFITKFEEFMEYKNGERLKQCLQATVPRKNNRTLFVSAAWKNMSQINESELATISTRTQPSLIRILLNVDCLQEEVITFLQDKLDEVIMDEDEVELVLQILEQFKFLDHLVGDPQEFTKKLFDLLEIAGSIDTQSSIINLFDEIIHDEQHEFVAIKLQQLLERNPNLTEPIVGCLSQLKISHDLKKKVEVFLLESLETSSLCDLDIIIRYLLRTVDAEDVQQVMTEMRQHIPFDTEYNHKILDAFKQCIDIQKHVPVAVLSVVSDCNKNKLCCIDIWLLFILYHKKRLLTKIESLIIRKIEQQHINMKYIEKAMDNADNKQCLIEIFDAVLYLAQTMLERKNKCVSECGAALYKLLYSAMNGHAYQHKLISSITSQIGSATSVEVNNSLHLLLHLTQENQSIKLYQTPVLLLMDYMESFNKSQIRLLYEILSLLSIHIDSNNQLQLANNLLNLVTKQLGQSGFIHQQQAGIIGCIQLIYCISTKVAVIAENAKEEAGNLVQKLIEASHHNSQLFATMCDELSLMIEHSRTYKDGAVSWAQYSESHEAFHPIHHSVLKEVYDQISDYISTWCLHDDDGSDSMVTQQSQYKRNGLEAQMWLNLSGKRVNHSRGNAIDSEATEYTTDNDDESSSSSSSTFIRITPLFVAQDSEEMMWIFSPLFRLFGILSNAHLGELNSIDSFLTASLLMFNAEDLQTANMIDKSKVTRQIMGDSIFSAINCIRELLNMFCAEYIEFCTNDGNNKSQSCHSRRKRIEARLCHRLDHLVCLQHSLETFMKLNLNKQFLPSFIPSQNKEETWLNSPPWKRKLLFDQKKKKKKLLLDDDNSNDMVSSTDEEEEEDDRNKNKKKKKKSKKKKKKKKKEPKATNKKKKKRSPLTTITPYFRALDLSVGVLLQFEILDRNYYKRASRRLTLDHLTASPRSFDRMISLRAFHQLLHDFCGKVIEICASQSARRGFASKMSNAESIASYTPCIVIQRYGFIFGYIAQQMNELIAFVAVIGDTLAAEGEHKHYETLPPLIQDCFCIFIECLTKLFKYKQFELACNRHTFDILLKHLCPPNDDDSSFTSHAIGLIRMMQTICDYVEDINVATKIVCLVDLIMKNTRFDKAMRSDYSVKITSMCDGMMRGSIGDAFLFQIKNASNVGQLVSLYLKHCRDETRSLQQIGAWYKAFNKIEDRAVNEWHALLTKKTMIHFVRPILECITNCYSAAKIQGDIELKFHIKCISHLQEVVLLINQINQPKTSGYLMQYACAMFTKAIAKMSKMKSFHSLQHVVNHLDRVETVGRRLQRTIANIQESVGSFKSESINKQWAKVADKCPKLTKCLDDLVLKAKTYVHQQGLAHCLEIRSIKKSFGGGGGHENAAYDEIQRHKKKKYNKKMMVKKKKKRGRRRKRGKNDDDDEQMMDEDGDDDDDEEEESEEDDDDYDDEQSEEESDSD
eukprot:189457_1